MRRAGLDLVEALGVEKGALGAPDPRAFRSDGRTVADAAANGMGMPLDLQLNERAYILSVIATIFVPLILITGFFGMNFGWMVDRIDTEIAFWPLALVIPAATAVVAWRVGLGRLLVGD